MHAAQAMWVPPMAVLDEKAVYVFVLGHSYESAGDDARTRGGGARVITSYARIDSTLNSGQRCTIQVRSIQHLLAFEDQIEELQLKGSIWR